MKVTFGKAYAFLLLMVLSFILLPNQSYAAVNPEDYIVENLQVTDVPNDDGTGLRVSWKPLPKENRIIEYRVYRGVTPDTLFYIGKIDVNVKTGVPGKEMHYVDSDWNYFLGIDEAPGKLKHEKDQTILFDSYPRDLAVTGPELSNYTVLGIVPEQEYFQNSTKYMQEENGETSYLAGLKLRQIQRMYKKLKTDHEYYYTVIAVNEARRYFDPAVPASGIPRLNFPEAPESLHSALVKDINQINFEWKLPTANSNISAYEIYALHKKDVEKFNKFVEEQKEREQYIYAKYENPELENREFKAANPATLIHSQPMTGYDQTNTSINIENNKIGNFNINPENIEDYYFVYALLGYNNYENFSELTQASVCNSSELPVIPEIDENNLFTVTDKGNDKGDYNIVSWGKPVVFLTNSTYLNDSRTKLLINYDYITNNYYKINNIYFKVFDENGNEIKTINEFYQDNKIKLTLPTDANPEQTLTFEITLNCNKELGEDYVITQDLEFDTTTLSLKPHNLKLDNEPLDKYSYMVYKRNMYDTQFHLSKKVAGTQRSLDDNSRYENEISVLVDKYDLEKDLLLVDPVTTLRYDYEKNSGIRLSIFPEDTNGPAKPYLNMVNQLTQQMTMVEDAATKQQMQAQIDQMNEMINWMNTNEYATKAAEFKNPKKRAKYLQKLRSEAKRSLEYKMVKTDGKGHFAETNTYTDANGNAHFMPIANWFNMAMFPAIIATFIFGFLVFYMIGQAKRGKDLYVRPIAGIQEIDNAIGRATEMGRPILFVPGLSGISDVATLAGLSILGRVAKKAAEYDTRILVPVRDFIVLPIAQEVVKEAHYEAGRPDTFDKNSVFFITTAQFPFVAGVNGIMIREKTATNFYMGMFWAEALLMTETGCSTGAIQIAGTDAITQIPFFITTCDYTLIGEELYAASAYLAREPLMLGTLKAQDYTKFVIVLFIIAGTLLSSFHLTFLINSFPEK